MTLQNYIEMKIHKYTSFYIIISYIIVGISIYSNTFKVPFYFDDWNNVLNPYIGIDSLSLDTILRVISYGHIKTRFVSNITFLLNYIFNGQNVVGYHVINIAIHIVNAIVLFFLIYTTLTISENREKYNHILLLSYTIALLWLAHPLATQSVTYIVQRMNALAVMFYLLAMLCYIRVRIHQQSEMPNKSTIVRGYALCLVFGLLAMGSKEIAATLPIMILLYEFYFFRDLRVQVSHKNILIFLTFICAFIGISFYFTGANPLDFISNSCATRDFTVYQRLLTQFRVIIHYISLIVYPHPGRLIFDYSYPLSYSFFQPITTIFSFLGIIGMLAMAMLLARKERLLSFCILCFFLTLAIESSVICLEIIFEHRTYMPSIFLLIFFVGGVQRISHNTKMILVLFIFVAAIFSIWTFTRNKIWQEPEIFWADSLKKSPNKPRILSNMGNLYFHKKEYDKAAENFRKAFAIDPTELRTLGNLSITYLQMGQVEKAERYIRLALRLKPEWVDMMNSLATVHIKRKEYEKAVSLIRAALHLNPRYPLLNQNMGHILLQTGRTNLALFFLEQAAANLPNNISLQLEIAEALMRSGQGEKAIEAYTRILALEPGSVIAHYNLALLLSGINDEKARFHLEESVRLSPYSVPALYNLANMLFRAGEQSEAKEYYQRILEITPELANTNYNYGLLLIGEGKYKDAAFFFEQALRIKPDFDMARANLVRVRKQIEIEEQQAN